MVAPSQLLRVPLRATEVSSTPLPLSSRETGARERLAKKHSPGRARLLELDVFRGLAALAVVLYHYTDRYNQLYTGRGPLIANVAWGHYGVELFFTISGFVIFMTLDKTRRARDFIVSRFSRLFPAYWVALLVTFIAVSAVGLPGREVSTASALVNLTMFQDVLHVPHVDGAYWSLQVEMFFYLVMLALFAAGLLSRYRTVIAGWVAVALACFLARAFTQWTPPELVVKALVLKHVPFFGIGIVCYRTYREGSRTIVDYALIALCIVAAIVIRDLAEGVVAAICALLFFLITSGHLAWFRRARWLLCFGTISYPLYLLHQNLGYLVIRAAAQRGWNPNLGVMIAAATTIVAAAALTFLVERPTLRYLRRQYAQRRNVNAADCSRDVAYAQRLDMPLTGGCLRDRNPAR